MMKCVYRGYRRTNTVWYETIKSRTNEPESRRIRQIPHSLWALATVSGVQPSLSVAFGSAPISEQRIDESATSRHIQLRDKEISAENDSLNNVYSIEENYYSAQQQEH